MDAALKSKYLEAPQEVREKLIKLNSLSRSYKRSAKERKPVDMDSINYQEAFTEIKIAALKTERIKEKTEEIIEAMEETREIIKIITEKNRERRREDAIKGMEEIARKCERKMDDLEERLKVVLNKERKESVLKGIQMHINRLLQRIENHK